MEWSHLQSGWEIMNERPVFVMGCPRSGTTVMGAWIGTVPSICDLGEYFGFVHSLLTLPESYARLRPFYLDEYLTAIRDVTCNLASELTRRAYAEDFCDSTPWNLLIADELAELYPKARFVIMLRHFSGVMQSLEGSWSRGYEWAGDSWDARALLWEALNQKVDQLSRDNSVVVSFDCLCQKPRETLRSLSIELEKMNLAIGDADYSVFAKSYASGPGGRTLSAANTGTSEDAVEWTPRPSFDARDWIEKVKVSSSVRSLLLEADARLRSLFPEPRMYSSPDGWSDDLLKSEEA